MVDELDGEVEELVEKAADRFDQALRELVRWSYEERYKAPTAAEIEEKIREGIGSGSAESGVLQVVGARINQPGMRWNGARAESVAHVRAAISGVSAPG